MLWKKNKKESKIKGMENWECRSGWQEGSLGEALLRWVEVRGLAKHLAYAGATARV